MDDHRHWQRAYAFSVGREWTERLGVTALALATALAALVVGHNWSTRYERQFHPVAGLSYEPPPLLDGVPISDISRPLTFRRLAANDAYRFNMSVPVSGEALVGSSPFNLASVQSADDATRALDCLTGAVYYEAASETLSGQQAVAQVVLNRVRHPAFPNSVCGVVFSGSSRKTGCQFTFTCDGALARKPSAAGWSRARSVARAALSGFVAVQVGQATHYHTLWVAPYWSPSLVKVANIGSHTFYRWKGSTGSPRAFSAPYAGREPVFSMTLQPQTTEDPLIAAPLAPPVEVSIEGLDQVVEEPPISVSVSEPVALTNNAPVVAPVAPEVIVAKPLESPPPAEPERRRRIATPSW